MKKPFVSSLLFILILSVAIPVCAQFFNFSSKAAKNFKNLERMLQDAQKRPHPGMRVVKVPAGIVKGNLTALSRPLVASSLIEKGPVIASLRSVEPSIPVGINDKAVKFFEYPQAWLNIGGKAVYRDQTELARDVDKFYTEHKATVGVFVSATLQFTKLYMLPVDGILYKPDGYTTPLVLKSEEYFIIYDTEKHTGQIASHDPSVYAAFKSAEQFVQESLTAAEQNFTQEFPRGISDSYQGEKERFAEDREKDQWKETWNVIGLPWVFMRVNDLGEALYTFHGGMATRVKAGDQILYVYELPVNGLVYKQGERSLTLDGDKEVVLYNYENGARLVSRALLETSPEFIFLK